MDPAAVTVALRLWCSDGVLLGRGFIEPLELVARLTGVVEFDIRRGNLYPPLEDRVKRIFDLPENKPKSTGARSRVPLR
jgi:hypothetical protein